MIYSERTNRSAVFVGMDGKAKSLLRVPFMQGSFSESWLQELIAQNPSLLQSEEIGSEFANLVCIGREVKVSSGENTGYIDNLYVSSSGQVVIVETKLFRNQEARRTVIAQIIDYAKDLQKWDIEDLDRVAEDYTYKTTGQASRVFDLMLAAGHLTAADSAKFVDSVNRNLKAATFMLMVVGDGIRSGVERMAEFITSYASMPFKLALMEMEVYQLDNGMVVIPNILSKTTIIPVPRVGYEAPSITKKDPKNLSPAPVLPASEFLKVFAANGGLDLNDLAAFISDLCSIPGVSYTIHPSEIRMRVTTEDCSKVPFLVLGKSGSFGRPAADIWVSPDEITSKLVKAGREPSDADSYLEFYKDYIDSARCKHTPYVVPNGFYYANVPRLISNHKAFMEAVEQLVSALSE